MECLYSTHQSFWWFIFGGWNYRIHLAKFVKVFLIAFPARKPKSFAWFVGLDILRPLGPLILFTIFSVVDPGLPWLKIFMPVLIVLPMPPRFSSGLKLIYYNKKKFYSNWRGVWKKEEVYFTPIGGEFGRRRSIFYSNWGEFVLRGLKRKYIFTPIWEKFVKRRGGIFYSNWRGICKKKKNYILLQLAWNL